MSSEKATASRLPGTGDVTTSRQISRRGFVARAAATATFAGLLQNGRRAEANERGRAPERRCAFEEGHGLEMMAVPAVEKGDEDPAVQEGPVNAHGVSRPYTTSSTL